MTLDEEALRRAGVDIGAYEAREYAAMGQTPPSRSQEVGAAVSFLGVDGLLVPSARWPCRNFVLFDNSDMAFTVEIIESNEVDWLAWRDWAKESFGREP